MVIRHAVSLRGGAEATSLAEIPRFARNDLSGQIASVTLFPRNDTLFNAFALVYLFIGPGEPTVVELGLLDDVKLDYLKIG